MKPGISLLKNPIMEYAWGSRTAIAELLGEPVPSPKPQAELWLGAHPKAPSSVLQEDRWLPLPEWIASAPEDILGPSVAKRFDGRLPFLLKVLAAEAPLSIQAHPNRKEAKEGFTRENSLGIPVHAGHRNYRDDNHKPELLCALTPFWALKGFRSPSDIVKLVKTIAAPELLTETRCLREETDARALRHFVAGLLSMGQERRHRLLAEVAAAAEKMAAAGPVFEWIVRLNQCYPGDIGALSPLFLNLLQLQPGEAMFIPSGTLHAYLSGTGVELMASSDNVLRGGLTAKHIDTDELMKTLQFIAEKPAVVGPMALSPVESRYLAPVEEFALAMLHLEDGAPYPGGQQPSVEILLCMRGSATITDAGTGASVALSSGKSAIVPACVKDYHIAGQAVLCKASVPPSKTW